MPTATKDTATGCRWIRRSGTLLAVLCGLFFTSAFVSADDEDKPRKLTVQQAEKLFRDDVQPLLRKRCFGCHGDGDEIEAGLDLRSRAGALNGGENGAVIIPGKPEQSLLYQSVLRTGELVMPPKDRNALTEDEIALLKTWIAAGAPWPKESPKTTPGSADWNSKDGIVVATSGGLSDDWTNRKYKPADIWAYQPIRRYSVPWAGQRGAAVKNAVDAFVQRSLKLAGIEFAPLADKRTLIRRATFDLTGLPPTPEEIDAFLQDDSPNAYGKLLNRLLQSRQYGERMARLWLDVARYADTAGFSNDYERPNAWRYRDYVIRSFNTDKPYDRFVTEQIAGDELSPGDPEMLIAVGFLRMGPWEHTGMSVATVTRQQFLDDVTHGVSVTFLAQGLRCASCHDHKFDPIPTKDYYRMQAVFAPVQFADRKVSYLSRENITSFNEDKKRTQRLVKEADDFLASLKQKHDRAVAELLKERGVKNIKQLPEKERPRRHFGWTPLDLSLNKIYSKRRDYFQREMKRYEPFAFSLYNGPLREIRSNNAVNTMPQDRSGRPQAIHILKGGSLAAEGEPVGPGVLSAVYGSNELVQPIAWNSIPDTVHGRRLALAKWIASSNNTLTARVLVNRIWQQHFGTGLVATSNNFGKMGARPSHPELLDYLATWFVEHDWSIKKLHRLIMSSATYQRSSNHPDGRKIREVDPQNALLTYYPPRRLTAEELRDGMLALTAELNPEMGGPGTFPEINWEVARQPRHIMGSVAPAYQPSPTPKKRNRRTVYAFRYRTLADPMLEVFNRPDADVSCERRDETTVTPQVFALFNGQFVHNRALALAARLEKHSPDRKKQIAYAYRLVYGRAVTDEELSLSLDHVKQMTDHHRKHPPVKVPLPTSLKRAMIEELTGDSFTWDEELDVMKHYQPDLQPWDVSPEIRALAELCLVLLNSNEFVYVR